MHTLLVRIRNRITLPRSIELVRQWTRPSNLRRRLLENTLNVIYVGRRGHCTECQIQGQECIKKRFKRTAVGTKCFNREIKAREILSGQRWVSPIIRKGRHWLALPRYPISTRLDNAAERMTSHERLEVAVKALGVLHELYLKGYAHRDFHAQNVFWIDGELMVIDFEEMVCYPEDTRLPFSECYDITGQGLESPGLTGNMCYASDQGKALQNVLGISIDEAMEAFRNRLEGKENYNQKRDLEGQIV